MSRPRREIPERTGPLLLRWAERGRADVHVERRLCAGNGVLFGGWAVAAAGQVAERLTGRGARAVHVAFLAPVKAGDRLTFVAHPPVRSSRTGHVAVAGRTPSGEVLAALVLVSGTGHTRGRGWDAMPQVPDPAECPPRTFRYPQQHTVNELMDVRLASAEPVPSATGVGDAGRVLLWARLTVPVPAMTAVAVLSDHVPYAAVRSLRDGTVATTACATVGFTAEPLTEYTLLDVRLRWADDHYCSGAVTMWSADGRVVGSGEQTLRTVRAARAATGGPSGRTACTT